MKIQFLEWDSSFFKRKVGELKYEDSVQALIADNDYDFIIVKQIEDKEVVFEKHLFKQNHSETKIIFSKRIIQNNSNTDKCIVSAFDTSYSMQELYDLAFESGKFSRFNLDTNIQRSEFEILYKEWVDNSLNKSFADAVLVYKDEDTILGFITYKVIGNHANIGLLAIKPENQGKGIGSKLVSAVENILFEKGITELSIPTQLQNKQACEFYIKIGYTIIEKLLIKHFWKL